MDAKDDVSKKLENLQSYMYRQLNLLMQEQLSTESDILDIENQDGSLQKYKTTKHGKAYKLERNFKKRCYAR